MRYVWDLYHEYHRSAGRWMRPLFPWVAHYLRQWDRLSADRVDHFVANSEFVASRIRKFYRRDAQVVHPPVDVAAFTPDQVRSNHYLVLGQLVPYKRADLAVRAFNELGLPLMVIGEGDRSWPRLRALARSNVQVLGRQPFAVIRQHLETCRALVFAGRRGLRHRAGRGDGRWRAGDRIRPRRRARDGARRHHRLPVPRTEASTR